MDAIGSALVAQYALRFGQLIALKDGIDTHALRVNFGAIARRSRPQAARFPALPVR
jgi:hypothetical protein